MSTSTAAVQVCVYGGGHGHEHLHRSCAGCVGRRGWLGGGKLRTWIAGGGVLVGGLHILCSIRLCMYVYSLYQTCRVSRARNQLAALLTLT